jgi:serine/threonine-protein kinase
MLGEDGQTKITDFGIAKIAASDRLTQLGLIVGTPSYMPPEQVQGHAIDGRADQYSLAVLAYEMLTGELPFPGEQLTTVVYKIVCEEAAPASRLNPTLGPQIEAVLRRGLSKKPEARYENCSKLVSALTAAFHNTPGWKSSARGASSAMPTLGDRTAGETSRGERVRRRERRHRSHSNAPLWIALLGAAAFLLWAAWPFERWVSEPPPPDLPATAEAPRVVIPLEIKPSPMKPAEAEAPPPAETKPEVQAEAPPPRRAPPTPGMQEVVVSSNPPGARIVLDQRSETGCRTPCAIEASPGRHTITASLDGYPREIRSIMVTEGSNDVVLFEMKKKTGGSLMVTSTPAGAAVYIDSKRQAQATPSEIALAPGRYSVTVEKDGLRKTQEVDIREGITVLKVALEP